MSECIERKAVYKFMFDIPNPDGAGEIEVVSVNDLETIPAADVRPVVRAKWEADGRCSYCHYILPIYTAMTEFYYCPNCGADMREEN